MPKTKSIYRSFGGKGATLTYYARLYLGPDHLLQTASTGYSETYKRFYFRDIQAIVIRKTNAGLFWTIFWLIPTFIVALVALVAVFAPRPRETAVLWVIAGALLLLPLISFLLGPTCVCHLQTAVQTEKLPSLKRLRNSRKLVGQLKPLIEAVQGKAVVSPSAGAATSELTSGPGIVETPPA